MPKINQYTDGRGYYIRSSFSGVMVTYQVSKKGQHYLQKKRLGAGSYITVNDLIWMQKKGYIFTDGSGPGQVDYPTFFKLHRTKKRKTTQSGCCCCSAFVIVVAFGVVGVLGTAVILHHHKPLLHLLISGETTISQLDNSLPI